MEAQLLLVREQIARTRCEAKATATARALARKIQAQAAAANTQVDTQEQWSEEEIQAALIELGPSPTCGEIDVFLETRELVRSLPGGGGGTSASQPEGEATRTTRTPGAREDQAASSPPLQDSTNTGAGGTAQPQAQAQGSTALVPDQALACGLRGLAVETNDGAALPSSARRGSTHAPTRGRQLRASARTAAHPPPPRATPAPARRHVMAELPRGRRGRRRLDDA